MASFVSNCLFKIMSNFRSITTSSTMSNPIVTVKQGKLRGAVKKLINGTEYYSFKGIPYAQPPIGKLRFKAPLPPIPWNGTLDAIEHGEVCPQLNIQTQELIEGTENCLFLNVYTQSLKPDSKIPVMVYIHGGGFMSGSGNSEQYGPEFLLQHNVILVTINYRLEVLGFLCLDIPEVPGNAGLKDQVAALHWVKNNISQFGGDPDNVTIFGESAGGSSITYHMISPISKGLFHKAISQSGTCIVDWASGNDMIDRAFRLGKYLGKDTNDVQELYKFFQSVPVSKIIGVTSKTATKIEKYSGLPLHFSPVVEKAFTNSEPFLTEKPIDVLLSGKFHKIPLIIGYNSAEGLLTIPSEINKLEIRNKFPEYFVPRDLAQRLSEDKIKEFGDRIRQFYNGNKDLTRDDVEIICKMNSDKYFVHNVHRFINFYAEFCKTVYMYKLNLATELNFLKNVLGLKDYEGTCHADDLFYIFKNDMTIESYEKDEQLRKYVYMITKLWTDFAKTGNPTPDNKLGIKWNPYTKSNKEYLRIDETPSMVKNEEKDRMDFWDKLYKEAGLPVVSKSNL